MATVRGKTSKQAGKSRTRIRGTNCTVDLEHALTEGTTEEVDWNSVGNICTKFLEEEVVKAAKVDFRYGSVANHSGQRSHRHESLWEYEQFKHNIMVFKKKLDVGSPLTCWMGRGIIDVPLRVIAEFLKDIDNNLSWDNSLVESRYVKYLSPTSANPMDYLGYLRYEHTSCLASFNREIFCFARCHYKGGNFIKVGISVDDPDYPCPPGVKRIELRLGSGFVLEPYLGSKSKTLVTYIVHSEMKGLPAFVLNQVLKRHTWAIHYIRRQLINQEETSSVNSSDEDPQFGNTDSDRKHSSFEEQVPTSHFTDNH